MTESVYQSHGFFSRRGFIRLISAGAMAATLPACTSEEEQALGYRPKLKRRTSFITPNEEFYLVAVDPKFRPDLSLETVQQGWSLELVGIDEKVHYLGYAELMEQANRVIPYTFECIGNKVGGSLIGNAEWHVVSLKKVLMKAGLNMEVKSVMFEGLDDFYSSVSVARATDDYAFIAMKMNGVPLPGGHGFPARVILPDLYGMKQPRWLRRITLLRDVDTTSYWERRGWAGEIPVKAFSRLDPVSSLSANTEVELSGIAFAGARGIRRVEISFDNGEHWLPCKLETPTKPHVWSLWSFNWKRPSSGMQTIQVRTVDGEGRVQTAERSRRFPDGATGHHEIQFEVG